MSQNRTNVCGGGGSNPAIFREKDWYKEKIIEMVGQVEDAWILEQIYRFAINMTEEGN